MVKSSKVQNNLLIEIICPQIRILNWKSYIITDVQSQKTYYLLFLSQKFYTIESFKKDNKNNNFAKKLVWIF